MNLKVLVAEWFCSDTRDDKKLLEDLEPTVDFRAHLD